MDERGLRGRYDHLILAGASLGVTHNESWTKTFEEHLEFSLIHHRAKKVLILDHRDCGAFREFLGVTQDDSHRELDAHKKQALVAMRHIVKRFPQLKGNVHALLLPIQHIDELGVS
jgi:hypothetical protein